jgi:hypothetical protein
MANPSIIKDISISFDYIFVCEPHRTYVMSKFQGDSQKLDTLDFCYDCRDEHNG